MAFERQCGVLWAEDVSLEAIASEFGTPAYVYSAGAMRQRLRRFQNAFERRSVLFCYALKANSNLAVIRTLAAEGAGADTVSAGEIERAFAAGVAPERIVYAGVAKTDDEMRFALRQRILQFNVESALELMRLGELAVEEGIEAPVALRINPDVAADTHDKISTGRKQDKFGIPYGDAGELYALARATPGLRPVGLHLHIGSQITTTEPFARAYKRGASLFRELRSQGVPLERLDLGGGFGVRYGDEEPLSPEKLAETVDDALGDLDCEIVFEPGRALVAEAGVLLTSALYVKPGVDRRFLVVDAGMNTLLRPALYGSFHDIVPVRTNSEMTLEPYDVVGPICESSDVFGRGRLMPELGRGDLVAIMGAGAYGSVMASDYNSRARPAEILVDGDRIALIKSRTEPRAQFANEHIPEWMPAAQ